MPCLLASLPMYDWPEVRQATDALWAAIRSALVDGGIANVPGELDRTRSVSQQWYSPDLLFSQTCGYPLSHEFDGKLQLVAAPVYDVPGCSGANYSSHIIVNADSRSNSLDELTGACSAYNGSDSMSGHLALRSVFAPLARDGRFFCKTEISGGHAASMEMVADGRADVAAIDCVSYALAERYRPELTEKLRIIARSPMAPALPFVCGLARSSRECETIRRALVSVMQDPKLDEVRARLFLGGVERTSRKDYDRVLEIEMAASKLGYSKLQ